MSSTINRLLKAYPSAIAGDARTVLDRIDLCAEIEPSDSFSVNFGNEILEIPGRVYFHQDNLVYTYHNFNPVQYDILNCLFSRHHNGYIREKCLRHIIRSENAWIAPFVIRLAGEYVIEILSVIEAELNHINCDMFKVFLEENPGFYELIKQRVISYWDCYYRARYWKREHYAGFRIIEFLDRLIEKS